MPIKRRSDYFTHDGRKTYIETYQGLLARKTPLLVMNGGPGCSHQYLVNLKALANDRQVIFYDQLDTGRSDRINDPKFWTPKAHVDQINAVRKHLKLDTIHLLGHSWGGMLALQYMKTKPKGIQSLIIASTMFDIPSYQKEVSRLLKEISPGMLAIAEKHHRQNTTNSPEYHAVNMAYTKAHVYKDGLIPKEYQDHGGFNTDVYEHMWGPSEFYTNGTLQSWSAMKWMPDITAPTLQIAGELDEVTSAQLERGQKLMPHIETVVVEGARHVFNLEQPTATIKILREWLRRHDD